LLPSARLDYRVKAGDTLSAIARKHDILLKEIVNANGLTDHRQSTAPIPAFHSSAAGQTIPPIIAVFGS